MMWLLLSLVAMPVCAGAASLVVGTVHRADELDDGALLRQFLVVLAIAVAITFTLLQTDAVRMRLDPALRIQADIDAEPVYQALARTAPEDAARLRAVLVTERTVVKTLPEALRQARPMLSALAIGRLGFADQASQVAWGRVSADTLRELQSRSATLCYGAIADLPLDRETLATGLSTDNAAAFQAAAISVFDSAAKGMRHERPAADRPADFNAAALEYRQIQTEISDRFGPEVSALLTKKSFAKAPNAPADAVCAARIYELEAILKRPNAMAAFLIDSAVR